MSGEFARENARKESSTSENTRQESSTSEHCTECGSKSLRTDDVRGEIVCQDCGYIVKTDLIDRGAEWTAFTQKEREKQSRVGSPLSETLHDKGMTTEIHWQNVDAHGQTISPSKRRQVQRLRRWQKRIQTEGSGERNLQVALVEIHRMSSALGLPQPTREVAAVTYRQALNADLIQGRSIEAVAASALYIASRKEKIPRSLDEFDDVARIDRIEIARTYRYLVSELDLEMEPVDPKLFVPRFCSKLDLDKSVQRTAMEILDQVKEEGIHSGKSPTGLAAAAIYTASLRNGTERTQDEVAQAAGVTAVTVRNRYHEQQSILD